jgi:hypothetical protein
MYCIFYKNTYSKKGANQFKPYFLNNINIFLLFNFVN